MNSAAVFRVLVMSLAGLLSGGHLMLVASQNCLILGPSPGRSVVFVGESVTYNCKVCPNQLILWYTNDGSEWRGVGGTYPDQTEYPLVTGELTLHASHENNNTMIACAVQGPNGYERSTQVQMVVQGLLEAPGEIVLGVTNDSVTIVWDPSFSLTSEKTSYMVNVSMSNGLMTTSQTTEPSYVFEFSNHNVNRCHANVIEFEVWGVNPVGEGNTSTVSVTLPVDSRYCEQDQPVTPVTPVQLATTVIQMTTLDQLVTPDPPCLILGPSPERSVVFVGESVTYNCKVCPNQLILWYINDGSEWRAVNGTYSDQTEYPLVTGELTLHASHENNNTVIACTVQGLSGFERSTQVQMMVQGLLEAPGEIVLGVTNDSVTIVWDPSFSLTSEKTSYMVNVSMSNGLMTTSQTTEPSYVFEFSNHNVNRCHANVIEFEVWGVNLVGEGNALTVSVTLPVDSRYCERDQPVTPDHPFTLVYFYVIILGTVILTLVVFGVVAIVSLVLICKTLNKSKNQTEPPSGIKMDPNSTPTEPFPDIKMDSNAIYTISCTTTNSAYGTNTGMHKVPIYEVITPNIYETID